MEADNINTPEYWNKNYSVGFYQDRVPTDRKFWQDFLDFALPKTPTTILEIGCGLGYNAKYASDKGHKVIATDFSKVAIDENRKRWGKLTDPSFSNVSIDDVSKTYTGLFNVVMAFEIIEHFKSPMIILRKILKTIAPDGILIFSVPQESGKFGYFEQHLSYRNYKSTVDRMFTLFKSVQFYKNGASGQNILGIAKRG